MTNTTNLNLPFILPAQAQKHVTHNEALMALDALVQLSVIDNTLSSPPQNPLEGNRYIIASAPTGDWIGKENQITAWQDGAWVFFAPQTGWVSWAQNQDALYAYDGTDWIAASSGGGGVSLTDLDDGTVTTMGVNADADTTNRLSVNSAAVLFNKEVDDVQVKLNKQSNTDTASFLYQTNFSGRAEMGTMGDDDFHFKVSGDGVTWKEGLIIDADTGEVSFPNTTFAGGGAKGDKGDTGATGAKGDKGDKGDTGAAGAAGADGTNGINGVQGVQGLPGTPGADGSDGANGQDGIDGTDGTPGIKGNKGDKGDQGDGLQVDAIGDTAAKSAYDTEAEGFVYLDNEANLFYRKDSATSGDWSDGASFNGGAAIADPLDDLVTRIFARVSPTQLGFCYTVDNSYIDQAKTTKAVNADDVVAVIADKSPNDLDLIAGGTSASTNIKLHLDPPVVGVDSYSLTGYFLKVTVPTGGFKGKLIMAYRSGWSVSDVDVPAGDWEIWSGHAPHVRSGFIGAFAAENIFTYEIIALLNIFFERGAGSKPSTVVNDTYTSNVDDYYKNIDLAHFDFSGVSSFFRIFFQSNVDGIKIAVDTSKITSIGNMFYGCSSVKSIAVGEWDTSNLKDMGGAFFSCSSLTALDVGEWDMAKLENANSTFYGCNSLRALDVGEWDTAELITTQSMFRGCSALKTLNISKWDLSSVNSMVGMFYACSSLHELIVGGAFDDTPCTNFIITFVNCALNQQSVDGILVSIENAGTSNGTLNINGGTSSAPSSVGAAAKTALQGRGWTVTTN